MDTDSNTLSALGDRTLQLVEYLESQVEQGLFTAWAFSTNTLAVSAYWADETQPPLEGNCQWQGSLHPPFDLASLTKPLFTGQIFRQILGNNWAAWHRPLAEILGEASHPKAAALSSRLRSRQVDLTASDVINHCAGFNPWTWCGKVGLEFDKEDFVFWLADRLAQTSQPTCYSDLSYLFLCQLVELLDSEHTWEQRLQAINDHNKTAFWHAAITPDLSRRAIPAYPFVLTEHDINPGDTTWHDFGPVHDTNASILANRGLVAGHAGLFGTVLDVAAAANHLLTWSKPLWTTPQRPDQARFIWGLDTPQSEDSLASPPRWPCDVPIAGHLGYTGTCFWGTIASEDEIPKIQTLLTNRTARRLRLGALSAPRLLTVTERTTGHEITFIREKENKKENKNENVNKNWRRIDRDEAEETIVFFGRTCKRLWNRTEVRPPNDIRAIRREVSRHLWSQMETNPY